MRSSTVIGTSLTDQNVCQRGRVSIYSFLLTCLVLLLAVGISASNSLDSFDRIYLSLRDGIEPKTPNYTDIHVNATYKSNSNFDPKGFEKLYNITKSFINMILQDAFPENIFKVENNTFKIVTPVDWKDISAQYQYVIIICLVLLILGVFMPLCGLCFCCCCACGSRSKISEKKHDFCKRNCYGTFLIICGVLLLLCLTCAYITNKRLKEGIQHLPDDISNVLVDSKTYLNSTDQEINLLLKTNFQELFSVLSDDLNGCSDLVFAALEQITNATSLEGILNVTMDLRTVVLSQFESLENSTKELKTDAANLKTSLEEMRTYCDVVNQTGGKCNLTDELNSLETEVDFTKLPHINLKIIILKRILKTINFEDIENAELQLDAVKINITKSVKSSTDNAIFQISNAGQNISDIADTISVNVKKVEDFIDDIHIDSLQKEIVHFDTYSYYFGVAICYVLLAITAMLCLGLIFGIFGRRPDGSGSDCCSKECGSRFLLCGVIFMFFASFVIAATTLVYFLVGITTEKVVCTSLRDPSSSQVFKLIDQFNITTYGIDGKVSDIIQRCHNNQSFYEVFDIKAEFDIDQISTYIDKFNIDEILEGINKTLKEINLESFQLLSDADIDNLRLIAKSNFASINFTEYIEQTTRISNITSTNLNSIKQFIIESLNETKPESLFKIFEEMWKKLNETEVNIINPMFDTMSDVQQVALNLSQTLSLGSDNFKDGMTLLVDELQYAQDSLKENGTNILMQLASDFGENILNQTQGYIDRVINLTKNEVGRCGPLSNILDAISTTACDKIGMQMNSFWFSLLCCMLLFLPTIVISIKLAVLYEKQLPFKGDGVETDFTRRLSRRQDGTQLTSRIGNMYNDTDIRKFKFNED